jgi:hypothetical protein
LNVMYAKMYKCVGCAPKHCMFVFPCATVYNMVYTGNQSSETLYVEPRAPCTMPPLRVKRLCFSQAKNCFFNAAATTTTQLVGRGSAKIEIPKIKQMTERERAQRGVLVGGGISFLAVMQTKLLPFNLHCALLRSS